MSKADPAANYIAAHTAAEALRVDPQHPGTVRLAQALTEAMTTPPPPATGTYAAGLARQAETMPVVVLPPAHAATVVTKVDPPGLPLDKARGAR